MCRWILPTPPWQCLITPSTAPEHPHHCPSLPVPTSGSLEVEITGQPLTAAERDEKNAKFDHCCNRSAQEKYQEFLSVPVRIIPETLNWNLWKLKWEKWVWPDTLTRAQREVLACSSGVQQHIRKPSTAKLLYILITWQGNFVGNRINGHAGTRYGQLLCKSACWDCTSLPLQARLAQG